MLIVQLKFLVRSYWAHLGKGCTRKVLMSRSKIWGLPFTKQCSQCCHIVLMAIGVQRTPFFPLILNSLTSILNILLKKIFVLENASNPPNILVNNAETINLQAPREAKFNELSLKSTLYVVKMKYKSSFFFRTVQEWNRLPSNLRILEA